MVPTERQFRIAKQNKLHEIKISYLLVRSNSLELISQKIKLQLNADKISDNLLSLDSKQNLPQKVCAEVLHSIMTYRRYI